MSGRRLFLHNSALTWLSACVLALGVTSFVFDLIGSHEVQAVSSAQPVVVDGEEVDPSEDFARPLSSDHQVSDRLVLTESRIGLHAPPSVTQSLARDIVFFDLASRPPPVL